MVITIPVDSLKKCMSHAEKGAPCWTTSSLRWLFSNGKEAASDRVGALSFVQEANEISRNNGIEIVFIDQFQRYLEDAKAASRMMVQCSCSNYQHDLILIYCNHANLLR